MADWTSGLPQAPQPTNIGGLLDLARKAGELEAVPYQVQQQKSQAANASRESGVNYLTTTAQAFAPFATKDKPTYEETGNMFLTLSRQFMPAGSPPNPQAATALAQLHKEFDALPKGDNDAAYKARRQWAADVGARYGGSEGNLPSVPVYDEQSNRIVYVPKNTMQRNAASGGSTGAGGQAPPGGAPQSSLPPGAVQQAPGPAQTAGGEAFIKARDEATNYQRDIVPQYEAYRAVQGLESTGKTFGPGMTERAKFATAIKSLSPELAKTLKIDPNNAATYVNEFDKWSNNIALAVPGGRQNQDTFLAAVNGQPNSHMDDATIKSMLATNIGLTNMWQVAQREAMKQGQGNFTDNSRRQLDSLDRRAFAFYYMDPKVQQKTLDELDKAGPAERARFKRSLQLMQQYGTTDNLQIKPPAGK